VLTAPDGAFALDINRETDQGLLELLPSLNLPSYRFRAEVRHNRTATTNGVVGLYFLHEIHNTAAGMEHWFCTLEFSDLLDDRERLPILKGNSLYLMVRGHRVPVIEPGYGPTAHAGQLCFPPSKPKAGLEPWHSLVVEVTPQGVRAFLDDVPVIANIPVVGASIPGLMGSPLGQGPLLATATLYPGRPVKVDWVSFTKLQKKAGNLLKKNLPPADFRPVFDPRGPLGLYVYQASASFRLVVVEPLDEDK